MNKLLAGSKEKIALCHLFYNTLDTSLSAEKLATTIKKSNSSLSNILENQQDDPSFRASLWGEIKFFSNKGEDKGTQAARNNAAKLFGLFDESGLPNGWRNADGPLTGGNKGTPISEGTISSVEEAMAVAFVLNNERRLQIIKKIGKHKTEKNALINDFKNSIKKGSEYLIAENSQYFGESLPNVDDLNLIIGSNGKYQYDDKSNAYISEVDKIDMNPINGTNQYT